MRQRFRLCLLSIISIIVIYQYVILKEKKHQSGAFSSIKTNLDTLIRFRFDSVQK